MSGKLVVTGIRSIEEILEKNPEKISKILIPGGKINSRIEQIRLRAQKLKIKVELNPTGEKNEDSILAFLKEYQYSDFDVLCKELRSEVENQGHPIVLALDGVTDPQNLGAIIRTAAFMGISGIILPKDRAAGVNDAAYKVASGGVEHVKIAQVTNLVQALSELKDAGFWTIGFSEHAEQNLADIKRDFATVIIIGNEEKGMRPLVKENCDYLVKLQNKGGLKSLNASVAAALAMAWASKIF